MSNLKEKIALVVGGSKGYGYAITQHLIQSSYETIIAAKTIDKSARELLEVLNLPMSNIINSDITNDADAENLANKIDFLTDRLDTLVITAAVPQAGHKKLLDRENVDFFRQMMEVNFWGQYTTIIKLLPYLKKAKKPTIILFTSTAGWSTLPGWGQYNISKSVLNALIENLGHETRSETSELKIFGINPWEARTQMNQESNILAEHIIPLFSSLLMMRDHYLSGSIFTPDGNVHQFIENKSENENIFALRNKNFGQHVTYEREKYEF